MFLEDKEHTHLNQHLSRNPDHILPKKLLYIVHMYLTLAIGDTICIHHVSTSHLTHLSSQTVSHPLLPSDNEPADTWMTSEWTFSEGTFSEAVVLSPNLYMYNQNLMFYEINWLFFSILLTCTTRFICSSCHPICISIKTVFAEIWIVVCWSVKSNFTRMAALQ